MKLSKFFCVAVAGATVDGRMIEDNWISEMAASYAPATYTANVNIEHLRGISPEPPFNCQGKVVAVEERTIDLAIGGKTEKRKALFAQVEANDNLVTYNSRGQKLYPSIEVNPAFAGTGKAYLVGLATTDSPASLGTEMMTFAATLGDNNPFSRRKLDKGNFFSATLPELGFNLEFEAPKADDATGSASLFAAATEFFKNFGKPAEQQLPTPPAKDGGSALAAGGTVDLAALTASIGEGFGKLSAAVAAMGTETKAEITKLRGEHETLKASVDNTDGGNTKRPLGTGQSATKYTKIDC